MAQNDEDVSKSLTILAKGSLIVFIGVFLSKILTYLYKFIIARNFGPESYGLFSLAIIIISFFSTLASLGLAEGLLRYASLYIDSKNLKKVKPILKFSLKFSIISGIIFAVLIYLCASLIALKLFHDSSLTIYLIFFSLALPFILTSNLFLSIIKANQQVFKYTFAVNILQNFVRLIAIFFMVLFGLNSYAIIGSYLLGILAMATGAYIFSRKYILNIMNQKIISIKESSQLMKSFISYSWPIIFVGFVGTMLYWVDSLAIGYLMNATSVGLYSAAFTIVSLLGIAPELFMQLFFPLILKEYSKGKIEVISQISKQVSKWIGLLNIPIFTLMFIFPEVIIKILFGSQYLGAAYSLKILAIGGFFSSFSSLNTNLLSMKGKSKSILFTLCISSIINFVLDIILINIYGINGAAIATSIVWVLTLGAFSIQVYISTKIFPVRRKLIRIIILSIIPTTALVMLSRYVSADLTGLIIGLVVYLAIYLFLIILTKSLDSNDYILIKKIISQIKKKSNFPSTNQQSL